MMPKQLINIIGVVVCVGILAVAIAVVAIPIYLQSLATGSQTAEVRATNDLYEVQVASLQAADERMPEIQASVDSLRTQIPASNELDDVFELVATAAETAGVEVRTITAGENAAFQLRTGPTPIGEVSEGAPPAPADGAAGEGSESDDASSGADPSGEQTPAVDGEVVDPRQQVDFTMTVEAANLDDAVAFLDALRNGPRLLSAIESTILPTGIGLDVSVSALTYVLMED